MQLEQSYGPPTRRTGLEIATRGLGLTAGVLYGVFAALLSYYLIMTGITITWWHMWWMGAIFIVMGTIQIVFAALVIAISGKIVTTLPGPGLVITTAVFFCLVRIMLGAALLPFNPLGVLLIVGASLMLAGVPTYMMSLGTAPRIVGASLGLAGVVLCYVSLVAPPVAPAVILIPVALLESMGIIIGAVAAVIYAIPALRTMIRYLLVGIMAGVAFMLFSISLILGGAILLGDTAPILIAMGALGLTSGTLLLPTSILLIVLSVYRAIGARASPRSSPST